MKLLVPVLGVAFVTVLVAAVALRRAHAAPPGARAGKDGVHNLYPYVVPKEYLARPHGGRRGRARASRTRA